MPRAHTPLMWIVGAVLLTWGAAVVWLDGWHRTLGLLYPLVVSLTWVAAVSLAAWGVGTGLWKIVVRRDPENPIDLILTLALGAGGLTAAAGILGIAGLMHQTTLLTLFAVSAGLGGVTLRRRWRHLGVHLPGSPYLGLMIAAGVIALLAGSTLGMFYDQWHYHLAFPYQWLRAGALITFERHAYSFFPANMGLLYSYALAGPGDWAAQLIHWWMGALTTGAIAALAVRFVPSSGAIAAAIFATTPGIIELGAVAGSDLGVAVFGLCAWLAVFRAVDVTKERRRWLVLAGVFLGLAVGSKYLAVLLVAIPFGLVLPLLVAEDTGKRRVRAAAATLAVVAGTAIVVWSPWALRNLVVTGDPVYPYLSRPAAETVQDHSSEYDLAAGIGDFGITRDRLLAAATLGTFDNRDLGGRVGPVYLWLVPLWLLSLVVARPSRDERIFAAATVLGLAVSALVPTFGRYLVPVLAGFAVGCGVSFKRLLDAVGRRPQILLHATLFVVLLGNINPFALPHMPRKIGIALALVSEDGFLDTYVSHYPALDVINKGLPRDAVVLFAAEARAYRVDRDLLIEDPIAKPILVEIAEQSSSVGDMLERLRGTGATHVLLNWDEALRMAAYNGRDDYFHCDDPAARLRIRELFDRGLVEMWNHGHLMLYRVPGREEARRE